MRTFSETLAGLEPSDHLQKIELLDQDGHIVGKIENKPGSQGSVKVYQHLLQKFGHLDTTAAQYGLELYAEHTADAEANPGKHPNIDRLLDIVANHATLQIRAI